MLIWFLVLLVKASRRAFELSSIFAEACSFALLIVRRRCFRHYNPCKCSTRTTFPGRFQLSKKMVALSSNVAITALITQYVLKVVVALKLE